MSADRGSATRKRMGSGFVVALGLIGLTMILLAFGQIVGWDATWRAFGVTPLQPPFFDMHVINDYAACGAKGIDVYAPRSCSGVNYNIPPTWLWLGSLGIAGADSAWMSVVMIGAAAIVMVMLFRGGPWLNGVIALAALVSPSVMMGVERGSGPVDTDVGRSICADLRRTKACVIVGRRRTLEPGCRAEIISDLLRIACRTF
jgi:hypothetical protein